MSVLILGGDGYLGWPMAMHFSNRGFEVTVVDNYFRRNACDELDVGMLYPIPSLIDRAKLWYKKTGKEIRVVIADLSEPEVMRSLLTGNFEYHWSIRKQFAGLPETVIHFAEQPSAPYSLYDYKFADLTLINNLRVTNNLLWAIRDFSPESHIIKLGTMGVYGTPNIDIEEGWLDIEHKGRTDRFLFPRQASSLYHTTKIMGTDLEWFAVRTWGLRVTDLMQGPVYGVETEESSIDEGLRTLFNYDEIFGTIINRFVVQSVVDYPLTVYGLGQQTRGYLNIQDTLQCIEKSTISPAQKGELRIFNQIMETFSVNELAQLARKVGNKLGYKVIINHMENPRKEAEEHYYNPAYQGLQDIGVTSHLLDEKTMERMFKLVEQHKSNIRKEVIFKGVKWQ